MPVWHSTDENKWGVFTLRWAARNICVNWTNQCFWTSYSSPEKTSTNQLSSTSGLLFFFCLYTTHTCHVCFLLSIFLGLFMPLIENAVERFTGKGEAERWGDDMWEGLPNTIFKPGPPAVRTVASNFVAGALPTEQNIAALLDLLFFFFVIHIIQRLASYIFFCLYNTNSMLCFLSI